MLSFCDLSTRHTNYIYPTPQNIQTSTHFNIVQKREVITNMKLTIHKIDYVSIKSILMEVHGRIIDILYSTDYKIISESNNIYTIVMDFWDIHNGTFPVYETCTYNIQVYTNIIPIHELIITYDTYNFKEHVKGRNPLNQVKPTKYYPHINDYSGYTTVTKYRPTKIKVSLCINNDLYNKSSIACKTMYNQFTRGFHGVTWYLYDIIYDYIGDNQIILTPYTVPRPIIVISKKRFQCDKVYSRMKIIVENVHIEQSIEVFTEESNIYLFVKTINTNNKKYKSKIKSCMINDFNGSSYDPLHHSLYYSEKNNPNGFNG
jgi:hypothetical protein